MDILLFCYALGIVPTYLWTYRAGREPSRRFDLVAALFAFGAAAVWFVVAPVGGAYRRWGR